MIPPKTSAWVYLHSVGWKRVFSVNKVNQMLTSSTDTRALEGRCLQPVLGSQHDGALLKEKDVPRLGDP